MNEESSPARSSREFCRLLFRHKKKAIVTSLVILCLTAAFVVYCPRSYVSEAKLFIRVGRESVALDPTATQGQTTHVQKSYEQEINSVMEVLNSRAIAERVVELVGVETVLDSSGGPKTLFQTAKSAIKRPFQELDPITDRERAIISVQAATTFLVPKESGVISIKCKSSSPHLAQAIVSGMLEAFRAEHLRVSRTRGSLDFFSQQAAQQRHRWEKATEQLRDAKNEAGVVTVEGKRGLLLDQIGQVESEAIQNETALAYSLARTKDLQATVDKLPETVVREVESGIGHESTDQMRQQLYALEIQERHHSSRYTKDHPVLRAVKDQREKVADIFQQQPRQRAHTTKGINDSREKLRVQLLAEQATLAALRAKSDALMAQHRELNSSLREMNDRESRLSDLQRTVDTAEGNYQKYLDNLEQARIDQALQEGSISSINTIQPASFSETPASPKKGLVMVLGVFLAIFCPLVLAFVAEYFDHTLATPSQVERQLGLPVLVSIPRTSSHRLSLN